LSESPAATWLEAGDWRPAVAVTWLTKPFWDAAAEGRLVVQRCAECGLHVFRPQIACTRCLSTSLEWTEATGRGVVNSFSIVRRPAYPELPSVYAVVAAEMEEGWYMMSNLIHCHDADVRIGMQVQTCFVEISGTSLPFVEPATSSRP
jgi:uncharacterized protein